MLQRLSATSIRALAAVFLCLALATAAFAQSEPPRRGPLGGAPTQERAAPVAPSAKAADQGFFQSTWLAILAAQRDLQGAMSRSVRQLANGDVLVSGGLLALFSFIYGVLHAAGPGHGKFVISSYALANEQTVRRGITLSFMAAFVQALSAIVLVGVLALILNAANFRVRATVEAWLESASWLLVAAIGAWLLWRQIRQLLSSRQKAAATAASSSPAVGGHTHHDNHHGRHDHHHHDHHHHDHHGHGHDHKHGAPHHHDHGAPHAAGPAHGQPGHVHDASCGHMHFPPPSALGGHWSWREAWALALSIGIRPCTGAIGVLLFAGSIGIFWAGVFATFAMAFGTALTVSALAAFAVGSRNLATRYAGQESRWGIGIQHAAGIVGASLVLVMGLAFFAASLSPATPL